MTKARLDPNLLAKVAATAGKGVQYVREQVSKRANRHSVSSEAALILWAKELGIATATYQNRLSPHIQDQVRGALLGPPAARSQSSQRRTPVNRAAGPRTVSGHLTAINLLITDGDLKRRCADILKARGPYDRAVREASTVLEVRLKSLSGIKGKVNSAELIARALHPPRALLRVSPDDAEQEGFFSVCKGFMLAFRNPSHHQLTDGLTREDALRLCGLVDLLLRILGTAQLNTQDIPAR